jgi:hypothetical protein
MFRTSVCAYWNETNFRVNGDCFHDTVETAFYLHAYKIPFIVAVPASTPPPYEEQSGHKCETTGLLWTE